MTGKKCGVWRFKMVEVELNKILQNAKLKLNGTIELSLVEDKSQEFIVAQKTSEGADNYYLHYHALTCDISEQAAKELIALGAKEVQLEDLIHFRI